MSTGASTPSVEISPNSSVTSIENSEREEPRRCNNNNDSPSGIPVTEPSESSEPSEPSEGTTDHSQQPQQFQSQSPPQPLVKEQPVDQQQRSSPPKKSSHAKKLVDKFATFSPMRNKGSDRKLIVETAYSNYNVKKEKTQKKKKRITEGMSKADIFAASVASAVDAADEEVYFTYSTSNSRTPSLTSLNGMAAPLSNPNIFQDNHNLAQQFQIPPSVYHFSTPTPYRTYNTFPHRSHFPTGFYNNTPAPESVDIIPNHLKNDSPNDKSSNKPTGVMRSSLPDMSQYVKDVTIKDITNVLTADKELMFDIQVKGRNFGLLDVEIIDTDLNVFATPIPTGIPGGPGSHWDDDIMTNPLSIHESAPSEFLGTILALDEPLIFPSGINRTGVISTPTGQVRLKNPGGDDKAIDGTEDSLDKDGKSRIIRGLNTNLVSGQCGDWDKEQENKIFMSLI
ncbi:3060_t:CDS:2 [Racocetra fulgida]|uniref:3060_t:CDS:1 n=1 Tax=Racocetra fulgida TaxID=60492 RepID=A0A9N8W6G0_9GLOM|nr:3060_t:CDS:2 [Racocetra fulgida]